MTDKPSTNRSNTALGAVLGVVVLIAVSILFVVPLLFSLFDLSFLRTTEKEFIITTVIGEESHVPLPPTEGRIDLELTPTTDFDIITPEAATGGGRVTIENCSAGCSFSFVRTENSEAEAKLQISYSERDSDFVGDIEIG